MKKTLLTFTAITAVLFAANAQAENFYGSIQGGWTDLSDTDFPFEASRISGALPDLTVDNQYDDGYNIGFSVGYNFGKVIDIGTTRAEFEYSYKTNDIENHVVSVLSAAGDISNPTGEASSQAFMLNLIQDIETETFITPYIGAGIGYAMLEFSNFGVTSDGAINTLLGNPAGPFRVDALDDDGGVLAYQFIVGASANIAPQVDLTLDYRYFATDSLDVRTGAGNDASIDYDSNNILAGIRYSF